MSCPQPPTTKRPSAAGLSLPDPAALAADPALLIVLVALEAEPARDRDEAEREAVIRALGQAPAQRLRQELERLLLASDPRGALERLRDTGVLDFLLPEVCATRTLATAGDRRHKDVWAHTLQVVAQCPARPVLRWAALLHDIGKVQTRRFAADGTVTFYRHAEVGAALFRRRIAPRLAFTGPLRDAVEFLIRNHLRAGQYASDWQDSAVRRFGREVGEHLQDLLELSRADVTSKIPGRRAAAVAAIDELAARVAELRAQDARVPPLPTGLGNALMDRFGVPAGPTLGGLMRALKQAVEQGDLAAQQPMEIYLSYVEARGLLEAPGDG